jgi:hypothetical protein
MNMGRTGAILIDNGLNRHILIYRLGQNYSMNRELNLGGILGENCPPSRCKFNELSN